MPVYTTTSYCSKSNGSGCGTGRVAVGNPCNVVQSTGGSGTVSRSYSSSVTSGHCINSPTTVISTPALVSGGSYSMRSVTIGDGGPYAVRSGTIESGYALGNAGSRSLIDGNSFNDGLAVSTIDGAAIGTGGMTVGRSVSGSMAMHSSGGSASMSRSSSSSYYSSSSSSMTSGQSRNASTIASYPVANEVAYSTHSVRFLQ